MEEVTFSLTSLLIVMVLSFFIPLVLNRIKRITIPYIVGEIVVGMIIGKSGFDIIQMDQSLEFLKFFGLSYLMFSAGLEIDFEIFTKKQPKSSESSIIAFIKKPVTLSLIILIITIGLAYIASLGLEHFDLIHYPLFMALIIATTSLGIVMPILKDKELLNTTYGLYLITAAVIADFVTMILISVTLSISSEGLSTKILLVFLFLILVFFVYRLSKRMKDSTILKELTNGTSQIAIRGSFALMVFFLFLAQSIGVEVILGAFLAGIVVSLATQNFREQLSLKIDAIGFGFLIPIFFILVGVNFDFSIFAENPKALLLVPILLLLTYIIKGVPALLLRLKFPWRESISGGVLLSSQLSLTIVAAEIGLEIGAISVEVSGAILLVAIFTSIISPITFNKLIPTKSDNEDKRHVVIIGVTEETLLTSRRLIKENIYVLFVVTEEDKRISDEENGYKVLYGNYFDIGILQQADLNNAKSVIISTGDDELNYKMAELISSQFDSENVIVLISDPIIYQKVQVNEKIRVVNPRISTSNLLGNMVRYPQTTNILEDKRNLLIEEVDVFNRELIGKRLSNISLPGDILIFSIYRKGETIVPHGTTTIKKRDTLLVLGSFEDVEKFKRYSLSRW